MERQHVSDADRVIAEASRVIWGYVIRSFDMDSDNISPAETAFVYSTYHYAVVDILEKWHIEEDVRDIFIPTAAFIMQADPLNPDNVPVFGLMRGLVDSMVKWMKTDGSNPSTESGASAILGLRNQALHEGQYYSFLRYEPSEFEIRFYLKSVQSLRAEIDVSIRTTFNVNGAASRKSQSIAKEPVAKEKFNWTAAIVVLLLAAVMFMTVLSSPAVNSSENQTALPTEAKPPYKELSPPANGAIVKGTVKQRVAPLEIKTSGSGYFCFILCNAGTKDREMVFFGHAGKTVNIDVPLGRYDLYYASGDTWYGSQYLFGDDTARRKCNTMLSFYEDSKGYSGYTLTLYPVYDGNMDTTFVKEEDFP